MTTTDIFWLVIVLAAFQPVLKKHFVDAARKRTIARIERKRGSRVILLIHRQESMAFLGFPIVRYIDVDDAEEVLRALQLTDPEVPIDLVLHTPGGLVLATLQIARAIRQRPGKVTAFVPHYAMSGGTMIALAANEIVMSPHAVLGPVDPQLGEFPAVSLVHVVQKKPISEVDDKTLLLADQAEKAIKQVHASVNELLGDRYPPDKADQLAQLLSQGTWTHDHPITFDEARKLGLHVSSDMPEEFLELMALYPQPVKHQPTVEYLPWPRHPDGAKRR